MDLHDFLYETGEGRIKEEDLGTQMDDEGKEMLEDALKMVNDLLGVDILLKDTEGE